MNNKKVLKQTLRSTVGVIFVLVFAAVAVLAGTVNQAVYANSTVTTDPAELNGNTVTMHGAVTSSEEIFRRGFELTVSGDVKKVAGDGDYQKYLFHSKFGSLGTGGGQFTGAYGLAINADGDMYVSDSQHRIQKFDSNGNFILQWGSSGNGNGQFSYPGAIAVDSNQDVLVVDISNHRIQKFDSNGNFISKWGAQGAGDGQLNMPYGIALDSSGNVYVSDINGDRIHKFDSNGNFITRWGGTGSGDNQLDNPYFLAFDEDDTLYVSDQSNSRVQKFNTNGTFLGSINIDASTLGLTQGALIRPSGVFVKDSIVFIVNQAGNTIYKFSDTGTYLTTLTDGGGTQDGRVSSPRALVVDAEDRLVVVDRDNNRIQKLIKTTLNAGTYSANYSLPGGIESYCGQTFQYRAYAYIKDQMVYGELRDLAMADCPLPPVPVDLRLDIALKEPGLVQGHVAPYEFTISYVSGDVSNGSNGVMMFMILPESVVPSGPTQEVDGYEAYTDQETYQCYDLEGIPEFELPALSHHDGTRLYCIILFPDWATVGNEYAFSLPFITTSGVTDNDTTLRALIIDDAEGDVLYQALYEGSDDIFSFDSNSIAVYRGNTSGSTQPPVVVPTTNQTTFSNAETGRLVQLQTPEDTTLTCSTALKESAQTTQDAAYNYPLGLAEFCFTTEAASNQVTLTFVTNMKPDQVTARKYNSTNGTYFDIANATITQTTYQNQPALQLTYTIEDNGELDLDPATGQIKDPVGLGVREGGLAGTGVDQWHIALLSASGTFLSIAAAAALIRRCKVSNTHNKRW